MFLGSPITTVPTFAISDIMGWTAQGLDTLRINEENNELGIDQLVDIIKKHNVGTVVIGP
jgi:putative Holliday junction resolvase